MSIESLSRRSVLGSLGGSFTGLALTDLLARDGTLQTTHHPPKAKRVIQLFMAGAASHIDLFDHKPQLEKEAGKQWDPGEEVELFQSSPGVSQPGYWEFTRHGKCGKALGEPVSPLGRHVDDIVFVHNVVGQTGVHSQGTLLQTTGFNRPGFPSAGSWVSYGLGTENENLPGYVVLPDHRGFASNGVKNWSSMFLPAQHQGTVIRPGNKAPIRDLYRPESITAAADRDGLQLLHQLNRKHAVSRPGDSRLEARIRSYELAARMQLSATEALDVSREPQYIKDLYGLAPEGPGISDAKINRRAEAEFFGRKCLIARRLLERGVRFVQIFSGNENGFPRRNWDSHEDVKRDHGPLAHGMAVGTAGLIEDLKQRGMLEDTIILWTTEFGRMPCAQRTTGRDHNPFVFTNWMCGGGIKGGVSHGESDQWGFKPLDRNNPTEVYDIHATLLHLLGIDHERLTVRHNSIDRRLTDVHGRVIREIVT
ncbi:MAG: DUF1501 domain-containing protein [Verrucomicrobiales bacterium]|nr:DUF1501 domain-containing protein [Verrucomicrobiales bacterium]